VIRAKDINSTMHYKAIYPEEVINGHRAFIARRRTLRPAAEYRQPTEQEWEDFLGHFERRRVALGTCGRAYSTSCIHEHSCLRCSLLRVDPRQRDRIIGIRDNLLARIAEAEREGWHGEVDGLKVSLAGARAKLAQIDQITASSNTSVHLGIPNIAATAGRGPIIAVNLNPLGPFDLERSDTESQGFAATYIRGLEMVMQAQSAEGLRFWQWPPLMLVQPRVGHISMFAFDRTAELIDEGYRSMSAALDFVGGSLELLGPGIHPRGGTKTGREPQRPAHHGDGARRVGSARRPDPYRLPHQADHGADLYEQ